MSGLVICCQCGEGHHPYVHQERCFDADDELAVEDAKIYPSSNDGVEITIWYPWCRDCYIEEVGETPDWDEEYLQSLAPSLSKGEEND